MTEAPQDSQKKSLQIHSSDLSFPKSHRLVKGHEFRYMRENAQGIPGKYFILCHAPSLDGQRRLGIIVSKKFHKHAVKRNRAKRIIREAYRHLQDKLPNNWFVIISRAHLSGKSSIEVQEELLKLIDKSKLVWRKQVWLRASQWSLCGFIKNAFLPFFLPFADFIPIVRTTPVKH